jgi:hypothetical protein
MAAAADFPRQHRPSVGVVGVGTLAVQHGNVIELSTGRVGIDDACTGVAGEVNRIARVRHGG